MWNAIRIELITSVFLLFRVLVIAADDDDYDGDGVGVGAVHVYIIIRFVCLTDWLNK